MSISDQSGSDDKAKIAELEQRICELEQSNAALALSDGRWRWLAENVPALVLLCRYDERFSAIFMNDTIEVLTGYPKEEFLEGRMSVLDTMHPDDLPNILEANRKCLETGKGVMAGCRMIHRSGEVRWVYGFGTSLYSQSDGMKSVVFGGVINDVTEHKMAAIAIQEHVAFEELITEISTQFINLAVDQIDEGVDRALARIGKFAKIDRCQVFQINRDLKHGDCTHEWCDEGIDPYKTTLQGRALDCYLWVNDQLQQDKVVNVARVSDLGEEARAERETWQARSIQSLVSVPMTVGGELIGALTFQSVREERVWSDDVLSLMRITGVILANVFERQRAERVSRERARWFDAVMDNLPIIISATDKDSIVRFSRGAGIRLLGYEPSSRVGLRLLDVYEEHSVIRNAIVRALGGGTFDLPLESQGRMLEANFQPLFDENGEIEGMVAVAMDVTERHRLQKQLIQAQKLESIGTLAGGIAHDYNNLLAVIIGNASVHLRDHTLPSKVHESLEDIIIAAERGSSLSQQMLAYAQGGLQTPKPCRCSSIIESALEMLKRTTPSGMRLQSSVPSDLPAMMADATQIEQVLMNLCINAIQASKPPCTITINAEAVDYVPVNEADKLLAGQYVRVDVIDEGHGMDAETLDRIFEPFFTTKPMGRGMGLSATMGIVERHGGKVAVDSKPGRGTTFSFWISATGRDVEPEEVSASPMQLNPPRGMETIVAIDDDPVVLRAVERILSSLGYVVMVYGSSDEAARFLELHVEDVDLVILDLQMPHDRDGFMCCNTCRYCPDTPILFSSAFEVADARRMLCDDQNAYLVQKPFNVMSLSSAVRETLDHHYGTQEDCEA